MWKHYLSLACLATILWTISFFLPINIIYHPILEVGRDYHAVIFFLVLGLEILLLVLCLVVLHFLFAAFGIGIMIGMCISSPKSWILINKPYKLWRKIAVSFGLYCLNIITIIFTPPVVNYVILTLALAYTVRFIATETYHYLALKEDELTPLPVT